jgi:YggT family protein
MGLIVLQLLLIILRLYTFVIIGSAILSWLVVFDVVNTRNRFVFQFSRMLDALTDPLLRPIRKVIPLIGGVDLSPVVLLLGIWFIQQVLAGPLYPFFASW